MLTRLTLRSLIGPSLVALALLGLAGLLLQVGGLLLGAAVVPDLASTARFALVLAPAALEPALPVALLIGLMVGLGRWRADGTWTALRAAGLGGHHLLLPTLLPALLVVALAATSSHLLAPAGRRAAARDLTALAAAVELVPGRFVQVGEAVLHEPLEGGLLVATAEGALLAGRGSLERRDGGLLLQLERGQLVSTGDEPMRLDFAQASLPIPVTSSGRRVELTERSDRELSALVARMRASGRDPSAEHSLLLERSTLPLVALLLPLVALPLALRWGGRPLHSLAVVLGYWSLQRVGDATCHTLGAHLAAALPLLGLALAAGALWSRWRDR